MIGEDGAAGRIGDGPLEHVLDFVVAVVPVAVGPLPPVDVLQTMLDAFEPEPHPQVASGLPDCAVSEVAASTAWAEL